MSDQITKQGQAVAKKLKLVERKILLWTADALGEEAKPVEKESRDRTPVLTGALRDSHEIGDPEVKGKNAMVTISVGGASAPYAAAVHENMEGANAKFLQSSAFEAKKFIPEGIARRVNISMRRALG